ncbi:AMP-binding enzyme [Actinomyces radicidentis]|uniref:AMP-binding enzyme n=1 Tax=Actinomyces radicidentis TaxID=111015 RepID=UPI0026E09506|nr:AMP-binding protein [Actinomyces radicidentis]
MTGTEQGSAQDAVDAEARTAEPAGAPTPTAPMSVAGPTPSQQPTAPLAERTLDLCVGGTRPDDVGLLTSALTSVLASRGLLEALGPEQVAAVPAGPRPLLVPVGPAEDPGEVEADLRARVDAVPEAADLVLRTSGSTTGTGSLVAMSAAALAASARATHARLGGTGTWVLALPAHHVAGLQVLVRSVLAGTRPVVVDTSDGFRTAALVGGLRAAREQAGSAPDGRVYASLVPTQLLRVLDDADAAEALADADGVLLGGAAADPGLLARARAAGVRFLTTYGMSETGGGCVYDGLPLDGVGVSIEEPDGEGVGRVVLAGPVLAEGYLAGGGATTFRETVPAPGTGTGHRREVLTADRGRLLTGDDGVTRLEVLGRLDDVIVTGGIKVEPRAVEEALTRFDGVGEACVVGLPDARWGRRVVAAVVPETGRALDAEAVREAVRDVLDGAHAPKEVLVLNALPTRGPGKVDRRAVAALLAGD